MNIIRNSTLSVAFLASSVAFADTVAEAQLKKDFASFVNSPQTLPNQGDTLPWAGGKITRINGQLIYTSTQNGYVEFNLNRYVYAPLPLLQYGGEGIRRQWVNQYGIDASQREGVQGVNAEYLTNIIRQRVPYSAYNLGGNGSVTAIITFDKNGEPFKVKYDGQVVSWNEFKRSKWHESLTGASVY